MKKLILAPLLLCAVALSQDKQDKNPATVNPSWTNSTSFVWVPAKPTRMIKFSTSGDKLLSISDSGLGDLVTIFVDGHVAYGKNYNPDKETKEFWQIIGQAFPELCTRKEGVNGK